MRSLLITLLFSAQFNAFANPNTERLIFAGGKLEAILSWDQGPQGDGNESIMHVEWRESATHSLVEPGSPFEVTLWMPSMGHGSAPTQVQRVIDDQGQIVLGTYQVRNMYFVMSGDWDVRLTLKYSDGRNESQKWSVNISGENHGGHHAR